MHTQIRKIGNSSGAIIPASLLKKLNLSEGDGIMIREESGSLVITPEENRPKYTLDELLAKCDSEAPMPEELREWDNAPAAGKEVL